MNLNGFNEIKTPQQWKNNVIAKLDMPEVYAPREKNIRAGRLLGILPAAAVVCAMGITVAAVSLSNKDTVENIYFDRDVSHNLIMEMNPQYGAYLTEEGIKQLEEFKPIALDATDHSGNGNDLKSAMLIGVMADKYTMTSVLELEFNTDVDIPADNIANSSRWADGIRFGARTTEDKNVKYDNTLSVSESEHKDSFRYVGRPTNPIKSEDKQMGKYVTNQFCTSIYVAPADKPNTAIVLIEDRRTNKQCAIEKDSSVRYTIEDLMYTDWDSETWKDVVDATYIFDIPTPKKLISADKIRVNDEFVFRDCKYNIKSVERAQSYVEIKYTCELTPDFYERLEHSSNADKNYDYEIIPPDIAVRNGDGKLIPLGFGMYPEGELMSKLYAGKDYPAFNPKTEHTAIIHFKNPQNDKSVGKLAFTHMYDEDREIYTVPLN